jgi:hypothetical protein
MDGSFSKFLFIFKWSNVMQQTIKYLKSQCIEILNNGGFPAIELECLREIYICGIPSAKHAIREIEKLIGERNE